MRLLRLLLGSLAPGDVGNTWAKAEVVTASCCCGRYMWHQPTSPVNPPPACYLSTARNVKRGLQTAARLVELGETGGWKEAGRYEHQDPPP